MIVATGSYSKKFGDICYTFVIFSTNISDYIVGRLITRLDGGDNYPLFFFITIIFSCLLHFICVYTLVGSRILLLMRGSRNYSNSSTTNDSSDATQYIALRSRTKGMNILNNISSKNERVHTQSYGGSSTIYSNNNKNEIDTTNSHKASISNNNNNEVDTSNSYKLSISNS